MLTVPVEIRNSEIHGQGVFAKCDIRQGAIVWQFTPGLDRVVSLYAVESAEPRSRKYVLERGFIDPIEPDDVVICVDAAQFMNFPPEGIAANTELGAILDGQHLLLAAEDILAGTEITVPPGSDLDYVRKMKQHEAERKD